MGGKDVVTTVGLTEADMRIICKLGKKYEPEHGKQSNSGVVRIAIRKALK